MRDTTKPSIVVHCDWGKDASKRVMAVARREGAKWKIELPEKVGEAKSLLQRLRKRADGQGAVFLGFDFPIGLPTFYGEATGLADFRAALRAFGSGKWSKWYMVCDTADEISVRRPFFPMRPGGTSQQHLLTGLGAASHDALLRRCERATAMRPAACMLFWTLGGNQVGKGAIAGWQEVIVPNLDQIGLWPFDGDLERLLADRDVVIAETYP